MVLTCDQRSRSDRGYRSEHRSSFDHGYGVDHGYGSEHLNIGLVLMSDHRCGSELGSDHERYLCNAHLAILARTHFEVLQLILECIEVWQVLQVFAANHDICCSFATNIKHQLPSEHHFQCKHHSINHIALPSPSPSFKPSGNSSIHDTTADHHPQTSVPLDILHRWGHNSLE